MKSLSTFLIALLGLVWSLPAQTYQTSQDYLNKGYQRYPHKSGHVVYKVSGSATGTDELYFDRYGWREAKFSEQKMTVFGMTTETDKIDLLDGEYQVSVDLKTKTASGMKNPMIDNLMQNAEDGNLTTAGEEMMKSMGGKKIGTEVILGKKCDVWEVASMGTKTWVWQGISLKTQTNMMGIQMTIEATQVEVDVPVDPNLFKVPDGITVQQVQGMGAWGQ